MATEAGRAARRLLRDEADIAFRRRAATIVDFIDPQPDDRILDAGCGLGFYLYLLGRLARSQLFGIEWDEQRLREGAAAPDTRARYYRGDVTAMPFVSGAFDKLIMSEVLEHLPDDRLALRECRRVLKPGGVMAITVPHKHYPFLWDPINYSRERLRLGHFTSEPWSGIWTDHVRLYEPAELESRVEDAGFEVSDVHLETRWSAPLAHHVVYGLGKFLVERNLVGGSGTGNEGSKKAARRWSFWDEGDSLTPVRALIRIFTAVDRYNEPKYESGPAVSLCLRAVKPA